MEEQTPGAVAPEEITGMLDGADELLARLEAIEGALDRLRRQEILNLIMILGVAGIVAVLSMKVLRDARLPD